MTVLSSGHAAARFQESTYGQAARLDARRASAATAFPGVGGLGCRAISGAAATASRLARRLVLVSSWQRDRRAAGRDRDRCARLDRRRSAARGLAAVGRCRCWLARARRCELPAVAAELVVVVAGLDSDLVGAAGKGPDEAHGLDANAPARSVDGRPPRRRRRRSRRRGQPMPLILALITTSPAGSDAPGAGCRPLMIGERPGRAGWLGSTPSPGEGDAERLDQTRSAWRSAGALTPRVSAAAPLSSRSGVPPAIGGAPSRGRWTGAARRRRAARQRVRTAHQRARCATAIVDR